MKLKFLAGLLVGFLVFPVLSFAQMKPKVTHFQKETLFIPPQKFLLKNLPPIKFNPFKLSDFKLPSGQKTVTLKNGKTLTVEKFLEELNELEKEFNKLGYTLRDKEPIRIQFIYPKEQLKLQKETLFKDLKTFTLPLQAPCEDNWEMQTQTDRQDRPKDFVPLDWEKKWDVSFGNDDFGVNLATNMKIEGKENYLDVNPFFDAGISFLGHKIDVLRIEKSKNNNIIIGKLIEHKLFEKSLSDEFENELFDKSFEWSTSLSFPIGPINVSGTFGFRGDAIITVSGEIDPSKVNGNFSTYLSAEAFGELGANYEIVTVGVGGER